MADHQKDKAAESEPEAATDQRRPGRDASVNAALVPLLRGVYVDNFFNPDVDDLPVGSKEVDPLSAFRGVTYGALVSIVLWMMLAAVIWGIKRSLFEV